MDYFLLGVGWPTGLFLGLWRGAEKRAKEWEVSCNELNTQVRQLQGRLDAILHPNEDDNA